MDNLDAAELLRDLALDLVSIFVLVYLGYFLRHRRWDQVVGYVAFNISLFTVSAALGSSAPLNIGVGFGLFAVLSIVRLRSEESGQIEIGYTMVSLVLGLMAGLSGMDFGIKIIFAVLLVATMMIIDFGGDRRVERWGRTKVELDRVIVDSDELTALLTDQLRARVLSVHVREIDYVRDTMRLDVVLDRR
ncbi:MAG: DUF4956 domain-containing protein [Ilumatobacteraceae bacterium]|jgi:hypothetical protein